MTLQAETSASESLNVPSKTKVEKYPDWLKGAVQRLDGDPRVCDLNEKFLRMSEVRSYVPYSRASIYRLIAAGKFPAPYFLSGSGGAVAWKASEIRAFINSRQRAAVEVSE